MEHSETTRFPFFPFRLDLQCHDSCVRMCAGRNGTKGYSSGHHIREVQTWAQYP